MKRIFLSPWIAAFIWLGFTICITLISLLSDSILQNISLIEKGSSINDVLKTLPIWLYFLLGFTILSLPLSVAQKAITQSEQKEDIKRLEEIVRTLPNITAISRSGELFSKHLYITVSAIQNHVSGKKEISKDKIQEAIRDTLDAILTITKAFDDADGGKEIYAANIMRVYSLTDPVNQNRFKDKVKFNKLDLGYLDAVLNLEKDLTTRSDNEKQTDPDAQIEFCLPIHKDAKHILPGAPKSFRTNQMMIIHSMDELKNVIKESDMLNDTRDEILKHFNSTKIKAFLSVPISIMAENGEKNYVPKNIAILNIHKFSPHIIRTNMALKDDGMHKKSKSVYLSMIQPYLNLLAYLLNIEAKTQ